MKVFIYADNLNPTQLKRRAPEHKFLFKGYIPDHTIHFPRFSSQWRCGLASITPSPGERVWGAVFELTDEDLKIVDAFDGEVPEGAFRHLEATVMTEDDQKKLVTTHAANPVGKFRVKDDYLDFVRKGVTHWDLPEECLDMWELFRPRT
jgi:gamma-glutamylcyclotransferase